MQKQRLASSLVQQPLFLHSLSFSRSKFSHFENAFKITNTAKIKITLFTLQATYCYFNQLCTCKVQAGGGGAGGGVGGGGGGGGGSHNASSTLASGPGSPSLLQVKHIKFP